MVKKDESERNKQAELTALYKDVFSLHLNLTLKSTNLKNI